MPSRTEVKNAIDYVNLVWKRYVENGDGTEDKCCYKKAKKVLLVIFQYHNIPVPDSWWFTEVFANYDPNSTGALSKESIHDIVTQYYCYHMMKGKPKPEYSTPSHNRVIFRPEIVYPHKLDRIWQEYTFVECTGKGSFGSVDVVVKKSTGQKRACKTIVAHSGQELELVKTEINLIQKLNHPNILRLHETYQSENAIYIITEYCAGGQLFDRIVRHQNLTEEGIARWIRQIASALAYIHMLGIVHRDIKPENLLLLDDSDHSAIKLIDFGLSSTIEKINSSKRPMDSKNRHSFVQMFKKVKSMVNGTEPVKEQKYVMQRAGTLHYMSPEMLRGNYDQQCDIFPLGILLYQLVTGVHPFFTPGVDTEKTIKQKILTMDPKFTEPAWSCVSKKAKDLCMKMLVKSPRKRITAADILEHIWFTTVDQSCVAVAKTDYKSELTFSVFEGLKEWRQMSTLKQAVLHLLASRLSENEIVDLRYHFEKLDVSQTGMVTTENLKRVAETAGLLSGEDSDDELNNIIRSLDFEGHGYMGYNEFISAILVKKRTIGEQELRRIFEQFDRKKNGYLTITELTELMQSTEANVPEDLLNLVSDQGQISFFQFLEYMRSSL